MKSLLPLLLLGVGGLSATAQTAGEALPTVYGSVIFGLKWEQMQNPPYGIYAVPPTDGNAIQAVATSPDLKANGGGVYADGLYYLISYADGASGTVATLRVYDVAAGWKLLRQIDRLPAQSVANDLTYDPAGDTIYGVFWSHDKVYTLGTLDPLTGLSHAIGELSDPLIALASDKQGRLYGIGAYGMLYEVNKQTAALTEVGSTGQTIRYAQSATFDFASGRLIWAMTPHDFAKEVELCEVNPQTGATTTLTTVPNRYELTGIYTESPFTESDAPARATDLQLNYPQGALNGSLSFALPTTTFGGASLSADGLTYTVTLDDQVLAENATAQPGQTLTLQPALTEGLHTLKVSTTNAAGRSPLLKRFFWAGVDAPQALSPTAAMADDGTVDISWQAPTTGVHGGYIDTGSLTYKVVREPDGEPIYEGTATQCSDTGTADLPYGYYSYTITAYAGGQAGEVAQTPNLTIGEAAELPYTQTFDNEQDIETLSTIDANGDDNTWQFFGDCMVYGYSEAGYDGNDWLVTPPFDLKHNYVYQLSFDAKADEGFTEQVAAGWGSELSPNGLPNQIMPVTQVTSTRYQTLKANFRPTADGPAYVGVQARSTYSDGSFLYIDNLNVTPVASTEAPDTVTHFTATPDAQGARSVTLSFTTPTTNLEGAPLTGPLTVEVAREADQRIIATLKDQQPGQTCTVTDQPPTNGQHTYSVTVTNEAEGGVEAYASAFVGADAPAAVGGLQAQADEEGRVEVSWTAPARGAHGGYLNPEGLTYRIGNLNGLSTQATTTTETHYTDQLTMEPDKQRLAWYEVTAFNAQGTSPVATTDTVFVGKPYALPFSESFPNRQLNRGPWSINDSPLSQWQILGMGTFASPADDDGGLAVFSTLTEGAVSKLTGPRLDLSGNRSPLLTFSLWHSAGCSSTLSVALREGNGTLHPLATLDPAEGAPSTEANKGEWQVHSFNLTPYRDLKDVQLVFTGTGGVPPESGWTVPVYIDAISIVDVPDGNLAMGQLTVDKDFAEIGQTLTFHTTCTNRGGGEATGYSLALYRNETEVARVQGEPLAPGEHVDLTLTDTPNGDAAESNQYTVRLAWDADEVATDNITDTVAVTLLPGKPYVEALSGSTEAGSVRLTWQQPAGIDRDTQAHEVTEDFESYIPFTIRHFGQWSLIDGDGQSTLGIQDGTGYFIEYPHVEDPKAYIIFNPKAVNLSPMYFSAHSGQQVAAAFSSGRYTANDDWLISPAVDGAQTISFWACSPDNVYYGTQESVQVLYSTTGTARDDFKQLGSTIQVPGRWTQYSQALPEGTRYFALRCTSLDQYILFLDDITYRKAARDFSLTGYNVYRDGELLNAAPLTATTYTDAAAAGANHSYTVTAVYNLGESIPSPAWSEATTGLGDELTAGAATWRAWNEGGLLRVTAPDGYWLQVFDASGRLLHSGAGSFSLSLPHGVYLVKGGSRSAKIAL